MSNQWIEWNGGRMPIQKGAPIKVRHRNGDEYQTKAGGDWNMIWHHTNDNCDIVAYCLVDTTDYSLLRPFDLDAAKAGATLIDIDGDECKYVAGPHPVNGEIVVDFASTLGFKNCFAHEVKIAPLCWVEGRPVYKDDVLYRPGINAGPVVVAGIKESCSEKFLYFKDGGGSEFADNRHGSLTWTKPKVKKEGWINLYPVDMGDSCIAITSGVYSTEAKADENSASNRIACVRVEFPE